MPLCGDGHWWFTLDYRNGRTRDPPVVYIDTEVELNERRADSFADFLRDQFIQKAS